MDTYITQAKMPEEARTGRERSHVSGSTRWLVWSWGGGE